MCEKEKKKKRKMVENGSSSSVLCTFAAKTPTPVSQKITLELKGPTQASSTCRSPQQLIILSRISGLALRMASFRLGMTSF